MNDEAKKGANKWLNKQAEAFLRRMGVKQGQKILDFGCNQGNYTIPAARIAGEKGKVYAIDKEGKNLIETLKKVRTMGLQNVVGMICSNQLEVPLRENSIDVVLLYDVLHHGYFPKAQNRTKLLTEIYRVLRKNGFASIYLTHLRQFGTTFKKALNEVKDTGFVYQKESYNKLVHDGNLVRGRVFTYRKT